MFQTSNSTILIVNNFPEKMVNEAFVVAHEVVHHAQNELGILYPGENNEELIQRELQVDCYAGLWAHSIKDREVFYLVRLWRLRMLQQQLEMMVFNKR